jgi:hypothetical protein
MRRADGWMTAKLGRMFLPVAQCPAVAAENERGCHQDSASVCLASHHGKAVPDAVAVMRRMPLATASACCRLLN